MASFFVIRGQDHGRHFAIRGDHTSIGRDSSNQIRLNDTEVSRQHARIVRTGQADFELHDCNSSNGTFVNSQAVQTATLHSGDRIQLGRTLMVFTGGPESQISRADDQVEIVAGRSEDVEHILNRAESRIGSSLTELLAKTGSTSATGALAASSHLPDLNDGEVVYRVSQAISRTVDVEELLGEVLELIFQWIAADRGCIMLVDDVTGELRPACTRNRKRRSSGNPARSMRISHTILDHVMQRHEGVLTSNAQEDQRWESGASIAGLGIREAICVPMRGRYGLHGAIYVDTEVSAGQFVERNRASTFNETHLKLMIAIAGQAALAVEDTQFYRAMLQAERLATMGQTIADMSHHIKNILQGISGGNYLVEDGLKKGNLEVVGRGWAIVKRNQERISGLAMDMLSFSKEREPILKPEDINEVVAESVDLMHTHASAAGVTMTAQLLPKSRCVLMDREAIHRALLNVVTNAIDAAASCEQDRSPGPTVHVVVELSDDDQVVMVHVADNGEGVPNDQQAKIFAPFQSTKGSRGTGLGLPVSQKIMREHGGDLTVRSEFGVGAQFTLSWPAGNIPPSVTIPG